MSASTSESRDIGVLATVIPRICSTGRLIRRADFERSIRGEWKGSFRRCMRIERYAGAAGLFRTSTPRSIKTTHGRPRPTSGRIGSAEATSMIAWQRSGTAPLGRTVDPSRGSPYMLTCSRRGVGIVTHPRTWCGRRCDNGPMTKSELIERIAQAQSHLVERDVALAVNMMLDHMAACLSGGRRIELRGFGSFSLRFPPCTRRPQSQDRNAGIASGEIRPLFQTGIRICAHA